MEISTLTEAKAKLSHFLDKAEAGEETIITRMGKPVAKLVPYNGSAPKRPLLGLMEGQGKVHGDFNEWPEDIARALHIID